MKILTHEREIEDCVSVVMVPERAIDEPGYIQVLTTNTSASSKHEFQAMAQMAYFQFQDGELEVQPITGEVRVEAVDGVVETMASGMLQYRDSQGGFHVLIHEGVNRKKILEAAYRFCTRWVRLDI
jgi:hypothetical protein